MRASTLIADSDIHFQEPAALLMPNCQDRCRVVNLARGHVHEIMSKSVY